MTTTTMMMMMMMMMILEGWRKEIPWRKKLFTVCLSNSNRISNNKRQVRSAASCILNSVSVTEHRSQFIVFYMSGISKQHKVYSPCCLLAAFLCQHIHSFHAWGFLVVQYWVPISQSVVLRWKRRTRTLLPETRQRNKGVSACLSCDARQSMVQGLYRKIISMDQSIFQEVDSRSTLVFNIHILCKSNVPYRVQIDVVWP